MGAIFDTHHPWVLVFGLIGNFISLTVYLSPIPTFIQIYKKKSTEQFQSLPYVIALFSSMLWIYYAFLKSNSYLLITINSIGCVIETVYIAMYLAYAPRKARIYTAKLIMVLNLGLFCLILLLTLFLAKGPERVKILGWVCVAFSTCVFVAPLSIIRLVIRTKSVEYMPFSLSMFLTVSAVIWFAYGLVSQDFYIVLPNILGFIFGVLQMALYLVYRNSKSLVILEHKLADEEKKPEQHVKVVVDVVKLSTSMGGEMHPIETQLVENVSNMLKDEIKVHNQTN